MPSEELTGEVASVIFTNPASGYGVVELASRRGEEGPRAVGPLAALVPGQSVRLLGRWTTSERHGATFDAVAYEQAAPRSVAGLVAFLSSERFPGVGEALAGRIVTEFGMGVGAVIDTEPQRLAEVRGVSAALADSVATAWRSAGNLGALVSELAGVGVPAAVAAAVHRHFGDAAADTLVADPYALLQVRGVRWAHAEALARAAGVDRHDERRLRAGAVTAQRERCGRAGSMAAGGDDVLSGAARLLGVDPLDARRGLELADRAGDLRHDRGLWWSPGDLAAEQALAGDLARLLAARSRVPAAAARREPNPQLSAEQAAGVRAALTSPVSVLTGGPGTGKTRTVVELVDACEAAGIRVALCAPTGRAAKRMEEMTGRGAATIHRLLEARGRPGAGFTFGYDRRHRLPYDLVVADEWSMADTRLAAALAAAIPDGAHLLLVGDADQLPSVGPGAVLRDLLTPPADAVVAATRLTTIHRQAAASRIVTLAHQVNSGEVPPLSGRDNDVFVVAERPSALADRVAEIVAVRAPAFYGCDPADVQVLSPMYRGPAGVDRLNERLKKRLNPARGRRPFSGFHEGDRVVQTRNDADLDVANGDIGDVVAIDATARTLEVAYPGGSVAYDADQVGDLAPAWCLTVHKAQGGEWPVVVLVLDAGHRAMLWRELLYTAVTRARAGLLLVGDARLVATGARELGSGARSRVTRLGARLVDDLAELARDDGDAAGLATAGGHGTAGRATAGGASG